MEADNQQDSRRAFWLGLLFWAVICLLAVLVRGVRWEEGYERAQVLLGLTPYPDGHPHARWYWNAFSVHYYLSALALWLTESPLLVCGGRQFVATLAIHLPVFGFTWLLTRRVWPAHLATLLGLVGANTVFQSYMPILPWATKATSGLIGMGWAFVVLLALANSRWRWAGLLFGLMPIIHLGQWPMILLTVLVATAWLLWNKAFLDIRQLAAWTAVGLAVCVLFALVQQRFVVPDPTEGAYYSAKDGHTIWAEYVTHEDMHRAITDWPRFGPIGNSIIAMGSVLILAWPLAIREARSATRSWPWLLLLVYASLCMAAMVFARVVHLYTGVDVPYVVIIWMPNRLTIHLSMLLLAVVSARSLGRRNARPGLVVIVSLVWLAALPIWPRILPTALAERYFSAPEMALFLLAGGAIFHIWNELDEAGRLRRIWALTLALGLIALLGYHQLAAVTVLGGIILGVADQRSSLSLLMPRYAVVAATFLLGLVVLGNTLAGEWRTREHLPVSDFETELARYLEEHSAPDAMVLTPLEEHYQMVLNRPVAATFETRQFTSYMRSLAATTEKLFADLYGVRDGHWYDWDLWQRRSTEEWQELGQAYGFRYVLSKAFHPLQLPERLRGDGLILYEIPIAEVD